MAYDPNPGRDRRRLIPLAVLSIAVTVLVTAKLVVVGDVDSADVLGAFVFLWMWVAVIQLTAWHVLTLIALIMHDYGFPAGVQLPTLTGVGAISGAGLFWWASPSTGAVCGLATVAAWLLSIQDQLSNPD